MSLLCIEDVNPASITIRISNTARTYKLNLNKVIKIEKVRGLSNPEIVTVGFIAGQYARQYGMIKSYDFSSIKIDGDIIVKSLIFGESITLLKNTSSLISLSYREFLRNQDVINLMNDEMAFYLGFLYGSFSFFGQAVCFRNSPRQYDIKGIPNSTANGGSNGIADGKSGTCIEI